MKRPKKTNVWWYWLCKPAVMFGNRESFVAHTIQNHQSTLFGMPYLADAKDVPDVPKDKAAE